jgi:phosphate transport system protein
MNLNDFKENQMLRRATLIAREIVKLKERLLLLGGKVEDRLRQSILAVREKNSDMADEVIAGDREIDIMEVELEEECLKILALHQPVASDLRFIITVLKVNNDLERIGDLAVNISEVALYLIEKPINIPFEFDEMASKASTMFRSSLNALVDQDRSLAETVRRNDDEVDDLHHEAHLLVEKAIRSQPDRIDCFIKSLSISKSLERIADLSTNIAEDVIYLVDGAIVRH